MVRNNRQECFGQGISVNRELTEARVIFGRERIDKAYLRSTQAQQFLVQNPKLVADSIHQLRLLLSSPQRAVHYASTLQPELQDVIVLMWLNELGTTTIQEYGLYEQET